MNLHERAQADALGGLQQIPELKPLERGHDQEDGVGPQGARLPQLIVVQDEVLAEEGEVRRSPDLLEMLGRAVEVLGVGEDGEGRGAGGGVRPGQRHRIERLAEHPPRGRGFFALGDQPDAGGRPRLERPPEVPRGGKLLAAPLQFAPRDLPLAANDLGALVPDDLVEQAHDTAQ